MVGPPILTVCMLDVSIIIIVDWWDGIYTACKSLAKLCRLFLGTCYFDLEGWQMYPPSWIWWGAYSPQELDISLKKIASLPSLNGFERSIHLWIGMDIYNFSKIAVILKFHENIPPSWILWFFLYLFKTIICLLHMHHCTVLLQIMMPHTHRKRTYIEPNLVSLPII